MNKVAGATRAMLPTDNEVANRARAVFRTACEGTDSYHALRLGQARHKALAARAGSRGLRWLAPIAGGAVACCALAVGIVVLHPAGQDGTPAAHSPAPLAAQASATSQDPSDDAPDVASSQMDLVQNLDFYRWLAEQPSVASASGGGSR